MPSLTIIAAIIAFLLPFERIGGFSLAGTSVRLSQIVLLAGLVLTAASCARADVRARITAILKRRETLALFAFLSWCALSLINAENLSRSTVVLAFVVFTASQALWLPLVLAHAPAFLRVRATILWAAAFVGVFGLWQFLADMAGAPIWLTGLRSQYTKIILGFTRVQSTSLEPLYFADYLLLPIGLAIAWLLANPGRRTSRWLWALVAVLLLDLVLTSSRGGYVGAAVMLLALAWMHRKRLPAVRKLLVALMVTAVAIFVALRLLAGFAVTTPGTLADTFVKHVVTVTDGAAYVERLETFRAGLDAFTAHPWLGVGIGGYGPLVATYALVKPDAGWAIVNNEPIELLAETGLIGLLLFIGFLVSVFKAAIKPSGDPAVEAIRLGAMAALVGMLVQYQTFSTLYVMHIWFTIGLLLAIANRSES